MSSALFARQNPTFEYIGNPFIGIPSGGCILDLRLHWTAAAKQLTPPVPALADPSMSGKTLLTAINYTSGTSCSLSFAARHPFEPIYYGAEISCDATGDGYAKFIAANDYYIVHRHDYYVKIEESGELTIHSEISWLGGYILIDLNAGGNQPSVGAVVEPFNVIFDPISTNSTSPDIGGISIADHSFTNSPVVDNKKIVPHYNFNLIGTALQFSLNSAVEDSADGVQSINGVLPDSGNINIQILG